jgi:hypothetical protein
MHEDSGVEQSSSRINQKRSHCIAASHLITGNQGDIRYSSIEVEAEAG